MTDRRSDRSPFEDWLAIRRKACSSSDLPDQVMGRIVEWERQRHDIWWALLVERIERGRAFRWAVYGGALAIGVLPYLFLAHVAKLLTF